jgi:flagellar hook capping protein FlgD
VMLHLRLRPGAVPGGEISLEAGQFSGSDGVMLRVGLSDDPRSLDGHATLAITGVRPNPSSGVFRISVRLTAPAPLDVAVLDLAGRRVATLFHGDLLAGTHDLVWDGSSSGGLRHGGVYFVRASLAGQATVRKLILLGNQPGAGGVTPLAR